MSLKYAILAALVSKPRTGYELSSKIDSSIGFFWTATHQQIYKELGELSSMKWIRSRQVKQKERPDKKIYRVTSAGQNELAKWILEPPSQPPAKDELLIKIFAGYLVPTKQLMRIFENEIAKHTERLQRYLAIQNEHFANSEKLPDTLRFQYFTLRRGIHFEEGWLKWAVETMSALSKN